MSRRRPSADMAATMYNNKTEVEFGRLLLLGWRARQLRRKLNRHTARNSRIARALGRRWRWTCPGCLTQWTGPCREHAPGGILDLDCAPDPGSNRGPLGFNTSLHPKAGRLHYSDTRRRHSSGAASFFAIITRSSRSCDFILGEPLQPLLTPLLLHIPRRCPSSSPVIFHAGG